jgi:hypothetical protein
LRKPVQGECLGVRFGTDAQAWRELPLQFRSADDEMLRQLIEIRRFTLDQGASSFQHLGPVDPRSLTRRRRRNRPGLSGHASTLPLATPESTANSATTEQNRRTLMHRANATAINL